MSEQFNEIFGGKGGGGGGLTPADAAILATVPNKQDKDLTAVDGNLAIFDAGETKDAGVSLADLSSGLRFIDNWDASTNTPTLPLTPTAPTYKQGDYYIVTVAGTFNGIDFTAGDHIAVAFDNGTSQLKWVLQDFGKNANQISYDNTTSGATSTNLQDLGDELFANINDLQGKLVYNYFVNNTTELNAITGMVVNEYAIQRDTQTVYKYNGTAWEQYDYNKSEVDAEITNLQKEIIKVADQTEMLALTDILAGYIVIRADDNNYLYRLNALPASTLSNWEVLGKDTLVNYARVIYVDKNGSDTNSGSQLAPKLTIEEAQNALPSDTSYKNIVLNQANWNEVVTISKSKVMLTSNLGVNNRNFTTISNQITVTGDEFSMKDITFTGANGKLILNGSNVELNGISSSSNSPASVIDVGNHKTKGYIKFVNIDFSNKGITLPNLSGYNPLTDAPRPCYIINCSNVTFTVGTGWLVLKSNSPTATVTGATEAFYLDLDINTPRAYSLIKKFSALGFPTFIPLNTKIINDDTGGTLQNLLCTTAYTVVGALGVGTPIDITKYQVQTDNLKANKDPNKKVFTNQTANFTISQADIDNFEAFEFNQTTAGIVISLNAPTGNSGKPILFKNLGTATINLIDINTPIATGKMSIASYNGTNWNIVSGGTIEQPMPAYTIKGNNTNASANSTDLTADGVLNTLNNGTSTTNALAINRGGTGTRYGADNTRHLITQNAHGFTVNQLLALNGGIYVLADSNNLNAMPCVGFVAQVIDANTFVVGTSGKFLGFTGLTVGVPYYVDGNYNVNNAGGFTSIPPTNIVQQVFDAETATTILFSAKDMSNSPSESPYDVGEIKGSLKKANFYRNGQWLLLNNQTFSRTTYPALYDLCTIQFTGDITNGSNIITNVADTSQFIAGKPIEGTGIPVGATVASTTTNTITLQTGQNATATNTDISLRYFIYGNGNGTTTVNLPDLRGRANIMAGQGIGLTNRVQGQVLGAETVALTQGQLPATQITSYEWGVDLNVNTSGAHVVYTRNADANNGQKNIVPGGAFGLGQSHENMQPSIAGWNWFVYAGI
jgi:microcystin-dependent protein